MPLESERPRLGWVDTAKGLGIFLVVVGHAVPGLQNAGILPADDKSPPLRFLNGWIYSFHMPLFFFLSGLFVMRSIAPGLAPFLAGKLRTIAYPYLVWSVLQTLVMTLLAGLTNRPAEAASLLGVLYRPIMQFWFLYSLFLMLLLFGLLYGSGLRERGFFAFSILLYLYPKLGSFGAWGVPYYVAAYLPYFAAGILAAPHLHDRLAASSRGQLAAAALGGFVLTTAGVALGLDRGDPGRPLVAFLGIAASTALVGALSGSAADGLLTWWGRLSLQIYVAHTLASAGFRILLARGLHVADPWLHALGGVTAGMLLPILLNAACERAGFRYAFAWPARRHR